MVRDLAVTVPLDDVADLLNLPGLDLIKAAVEGWELRMLKGAARSIERFRPCMMLELMDHFLNRAGDSSTPRCVSWVQLDAGRQLGVKGGLWSQAGHRRTLHLSEFH